MSMEGIHDMMRRRLLERAGLHEAKGSIGMTLDEIARENWSDEFEGLMRNRLIMGAFRYGPLKAQEKGVYDCIGSIVRRAAKYRATGNDELLVDIANLALVEYVKGAHPKKHFSSIDDGEHVRKS